MQRAREGLFVPYHSKKKNGTQCHLWEAEGSVISVAMCSTVFCVVFLDQTPDLPEAPAQTKTPGPGVQPAGPSQSQNATKYA